MQDLVFNFVSDSLVEGKCSSVTCGNLSRSFVTSYVFRSLPDTLIILVDRFTISANGVKKDKRLVDIDYLINVPLSFEDNDATHFVQYKLKSIVAHYGEAVNSGHYFSNIVYESDSQFCVVACDDTVIHPGPVESVLLLDDAVKCSAYLLLYDRVKIPCDVLITVVRLLRHAYGFRKLYKHFIKINDSSLICRRQVVKQVLAGVCDSTYWYFIGDMQKCNFENLLSLLYNIFNYVSFNDEWRDAFFLKVFSVKNNDRCTETSCFNEFCILQVSEPLCTSDSVLRSAAVCAAAAQVSDNLISGAMESHFSFPRFTHFKF